MNRKPRRTSGRRCNSPTTVASQPASTRADLVCSPPIRTLASLPNVPVATPARRPNGVGRVHMRSR
jgi:hypothetical protein